VNALFKFVIWVTCNPRILLGVSLISLSSRLLRAFIFLANFFSYCFEMAEEGF
jgi:hypothetical protein